MSYVNYGGVGKMVSWTTFILGSKMVTTNLMLGYYRAKAGKRADEDKDVIPYVWVEKGGDADQMVERFKAIVQNDLENIPIGLVLMGAAIGIPYGYTVEDGQMHLGFWWFSAFCFLLGRIFHSIFFALGMQPWRTVAFAVAFCGGTLLHLIMFFVYNCSYLGTE